MNDKERQSLTGQLKEKLIQQSIQRRLKNNSKEPEMRQPNGFRSETEIPEDYGRFESLPGYKQVKIMDQGAAKLGLENPFFKLHQGISGATCQIDGQDYINFASYNYLGFSGYAKVSEAAKLAIDQFGTSVSASRPVSGDRPIHRQLEQALAKVYQVEDAIVMVSGHATNVTMIGYLFGPKDLIIHDELIHNSVVQGALLSGATRLTFPHNDWQALDRILNQQRRQFARVLIVLEGIYSMDGDYPELPRFIDIKSRYRSFLMIDEAHSFGVMGKKGLGIREHFDLKGTDVDIWMGTLSKALAGCGGYVAGDASLIKHLKYLAPGFLYSVGMSPPLAAASLAALDCLRNEPYRVEQLQANGKFFIHACKSAGINTGTSTGYAIVPAIVGGSLKATRLSSALFRRGINVQPILYPAVPEKSARLRFFISSDHTHEQLERTADYLVQELKQL